MLSVKNNYAIKGNDYQTNIARKWSLVVGERIREKPELRTRVILDFVDQNFGWGRLDKILHVAKKEMFRGRHFMTYYTCSKYYGRTRMHDNVVP